MILILVWACDSSHRYPIDAPSATEAFYGDQLRSVNAELETRKTTEELVFKKLYASQQLGWPEDISSEFDQLLKLKGLNHELYFFGSDFYSRWEKFDELNQLVDRWLRIHRPTSEDLKLKAMALNGLGQQDQAGSMLWSLSTDSKDPESLRFAARSYLKLADTARSMMSFARLAAISPTDSALLQEYIPLLLNAGYTSRASDLLVYQEPYITGYPGKAVLANTLYQMGEVDQALSILRSYAVPEAYTQLVDWYREQMNWDSAVYYIDRLITMDSSRAYLFKKAVILEDQGALDASLDNLNAIIVRNPEDSVAISRAAEVEGKIAYLRRIREARRKIPVFSITPKKSTDNE